LHGHRPPSLLGCAIASLRLVATQAQFLMSLSAIGDCLKSSNGSAFAEAPSIDGSRRDSSPPLLPWQGRHPRQSVGECHEQYRRRSRAGTRLCGYLYIKGAHRHFNGMSACWHIPATLPRV